MRRGTDDDELRALRIHQKSANIPQKARRVYEKEVRNRYGFSSGSYSYSRAVNVEIREAERALMLSC